MPGSGSGVELRRPSSLAELGTVATGDVLLAGGTEVVPLLRDRILDAETLVDVRAIVPRGVRTATVTDEQQLSSDNNYGKVTIGAGTTVAELEVDPTIPDALREAARLAASPQLRNMGSIGGNLLQATRCWYWRLRFPCRLHGGERCHAREGEHREHAIFANDFCASAHPSDLAAALLALGAKLRTSARELPIADLYRLPDEGDRSTTTLAPGEVILEIDVPTPDASTYLKAMDRKRWSFPIVGVAAARSGGGTRVALAGVAPIPWLLEGDVDAATPLPQTAYKVDVARALVARARAALETAAPAA